MTAVIEVQGLTKRYGGHTAVDAISLTVRSGEVYGFLGPNGAGKTTTLRMLLGLIAPSAGTVSVLGERPGTTTALARTGSLIEGPAFYPYLSGRDNLRVLARYAGVPARRVHGVLAMVALDSRGGDRFSTYSLGMKQRLGVAAALLKDPELLILDEPTNGLDPAGMRDMRRLIQELGASGRTVVLSSHLMSEVQADLRSGRRHRLRQDADREHRGRPTRRWRPRRRRDTLGSRPGGARRDAGGPAGAPRCGHSPGSGGGQAHRRHHPLAGGGGPRRDRGTARHPAARRRVLRNDAGRHESGVGPCLRSFAWRGLSSSS